MRRAVFQKGDVVVLKQDLNIAGEIFSAGTEGVVIAEAGEQDYTIELLEPKAEIVRVPATALDPVQP
ncbi:MAG: hypothetical protein JWN93_3978 [Hyphomicrobiales bacterium]|nr:hypothetical protein [Hyphomicrobiales bacterium]